MSMCVRGLALSLYGFRVLGILRRCCSSMGEVGLHVKREGMRPHDTWLEGFTQSRRILLGYLDGVVLGS